MFNFLSVMDMAHTIELFFIDGGGGLNWIGEAVGWIIGLFGSFVGLGIIVFTIVLKLVTLPLDIYSKAKMRKNSLKMEKMRPQLEKLQKQYQNDQQTYNMKMMELYKKNGYSMFGACLPMIVTLVIFFVVLGAFTSYSQYSNVRVYNDMGNSYSEAVIAFAPEADEPVVSEPQKTGQTNGEGEEYYLITRTTRAYDEESFLAYVRTESYNTTDAAQIADPSSIDWESLRAEGGQEYDEDTIYYIQVETILSSADEEVQAALAAIREAHAEDETPFTEEQAAEEYIRNVGRAAAKEAYYEGRAGFFWVKNIWLPDTSYNHPVTGYSDFADSANKVSVEITPEFYEEVTYDLAYEKGAANGYYILIVISIGSMFLSQFIISKSNKAQNELQTADGRGQKTQKVMMVVMPVIFGIFSFMYSAAFSIYMIVSNLFGIVSTVLINLVIDKKFRKAEELEIQEKYNKRIPQAARAAGGREKDKKFDPQASMQKKGSDSARKGGK